MQKLYCPRGGVSRLTFSPDGDMLAGFGAPTRPIVGRERAVLYCWTRSRDWEPTGLEHEGPITGVAFHPTGRTLAYAGTARGGGAHEPPPTLPDEAPTPSVWRRRFARESLRPFTGVRLYSLTGTDEFVPNRVTVPPPEATSLSPGAWACGLAFTPDGRVLLAGHVEPYGFLRSRASIYHWHFTERDGVWRAATAVAAIGETANGGALVDGFLALTGTWGVAVCPVESTSGLYVPDVQEAAAVSVSPQRELVAMCERGPVDVWHLRQAESVARVGAGWGSITALAFSPDGETLAIGHSGNTVTFWNPSSGTTVAERDFGVGPPTALAYAPDGLTLAVAGRTGLVVVDTD